MTKEAKPARPAKKQEVDLDKLSEKADKLLALYGQPYLHPLLAKHGVDKIFGNRTPPIRIKEKATGSLIGDFSLIQQYPTMYRVLVIEYPGAPKGLLGEMQAIYFFDLELGVKIQQDPRQAIDLLNTIEQVLERQKAA